MKFQELQKKTDDLLILDKKTLRNLETKEDTLDLNIKYWLKTNKLIKLKNGVYIPEEKWKREPEKDPYLEYIANQLLFPSYVSLEYVLAKYQLLTEAVTVVTSATTKTGRTFNNDLAGFDYYSISERLFTGYYLKSFRSAFINMATKEKALFDFLYLRFWEREPTPDTIEDLRINWENLTTKEIKKSRKFSELTNNKNIKKAFDIIMNNDLFKG